MAGVGEGFGKTMGQAAIIGGLVLGLYLFRDQIADWIKGLIPGKDDVGGAIENAGGLAPGSIVGQDGQSLDTICKTRYGSNFLWNPFKGACVNGWTGQGIIDTSVPGTTPGVLSDAVNPSGNPVQVLTVNNMCDFEPFKSSSLCSRAPITTPGYNDALAGTENLYTGDAATAYANAQAIRAAHAVTPAMTYQGVRSLDTDKYLLQTFGGNHVHYDLKLSESLGMMIGGGGPGASFGWGIIRLVDNPNTVSDERGQVVTGVTGGNNPFAANAFSPFLRTAINYENTLLGGA